MLRRAEGCWGRAGDRRNESVRMGRGTPHPRKDPGAAGGSCPQRGKRRKDSPPWCKRQTPPRKTTLGGSCGPSEPGLPRRAVSSSSSPPPPPRCLGMSGRGHCGGSVFGRAPPLAQARCRFRRETARAARMRGRKWLSEGFRGPPVSERRSGVSSPSWRRLVVGQRPFSGFSTPICPGPVASRRCAPPFPTAGIPR